MNLTKFELLYFINLGEELIAICVHILSYMVGVKDGKLCVLTDDKGASGKIVVMGTTAFDLSVDDKISMTSRELVQKIMEPNGINIVF